MFLHFRLSFGSEITPILAFSPFVFTPGIITLLCLLFILTMHNLDEFTAQNKAAVAACEGQTSTRDGGWKRFGFGEVMAVQPQGITGTGAPRVA